MKKHPAIMIISILLLLLIVGATFAWVLKTQAAQLRQEEETAVRAAAEDIVTAAGIISGEAENAAGKAEKMLRRELAADHIYAHRATSGISLEHSFRQYDEAIADGARYIEQDIVISGDGTLYVSHDLTAYRLTGVNRAFADMTDEEIDALRTRAGEKTLRLSEVFDRYGRDVDYVIELKSADRRTIDAFAALVDQYGFQNQIIVQCFYLDTLQILEDIYPDMPKLYLVEYAGELDKGYEAPYVDIISVELSMMTEGNINRAHEGGKQFNVWPLTNEGAVFSDAQLRRAIDLGVDTYFTDDVKQAMAIEEDYGYEKRYQK